MEYLKIKSPAGRPAQTISIIAYPEAGAKQPRIALYSWERPESPSIPGKN